VITGDLQDEEVVLKRPRLGRPGKDEPFPTKTIFGARASVGGLKEQECRIEAQGLVLCPDHQRT
jgi:hypothetical protein